MRRAARPCSRRARARGVAAVVCAALVAGACTGEPDVSAPTATASPTAVEAGARLAATGGDVWAWRQRVVLEGDCEGVSLLVDGERIDVPVIVDASTFAADVPIREGEQLVAARCTLPDGSVQETEPVAYTGMLRARPTARIDVRVAGGVVVLDGSASEATEPDGSPVASFAWTASRGNPAPLLVAGAGGDRPFGGEVRSRRIRVAPPAADGEYFVSLTVADAEGREDTSTTYFVVEGGRPRVVDLMTEHPSWIDGAVVYAPIHQLWGDRGFRSVERWLPYLAELGVDALWLWPPVTRRAVGQEYAIADYFTIDPEWGRPADLRRFVRRAHELGLRVLLDFVPNHSSIKHRYYRDTVEHGEASHYWDFYDRRPNGEFTHYFDWTHLPNLNYDNPQVRRMTIEAFSYWIREFDVDGFRVDAAWGIKRRRPGFWRPWRRELKRIKPDLLLLAEASGGDPYYFSHGFDVGYDWTDHPGTWAWTSVFDFPEAISELLEPALRNQDRGYAPDALILRFLNNNDTGVRFVHTYGADLTRVASAMQFTLPGVPLMFAGDEIGANYVPYTNITPIPWRDRFGLRPWYRRLIRLREDVPALRSREMVLLEVAPPSAIAYVRPSLPGGSPVLVVLNYGRAASVELPDEPAVREVVAGGAVEDLLTGERLGVPATGAPSLRMAATSARVLVPAGGGP